MCMVCHYFTCNMHFPIIIIIIIMDTYIAPVSAKFDAHGA